MESTQSSKLDSASEWESAAPLRVLLDARKLRDGGIGRYIKNVIIGVTARPEVQLGIVVTPEVAASATMGRATWRDRVTVVVDDAKPYSVDEYLRMPRRLPIAEYDLYHSPHFTLPYGIHIPSIATVHDMIHLTHPERFYYPMVAKSLLASAVKRASRVIAVSQATYDDLYARLRIRNFESRKISVLPNALDPYFQQRVQGADFVQQRFGVRGNFVLAVVSMCKPHKGVSDLLRVFRTVKRRILDQRKSQLGSAFSDVKLLLTGKAAEDLIESDDFVREHADAKDVYLLGHVSNKELLHLYAAARALIVPSLAEGFCLPILEAHAQGTPVVARPVPAVKEILTQDDFVCADFSCRAFEEALMHFFAHQAQAGPYVKPPIPTAVLKQYDCLEIGRALTQVYLETVRGPE